MRSQTSTKQLINSQIEKSSPETDLISPKIEQPKKEVLVLELPASKPIKKIDNTKELAGLNEAQKKIYEQSKYDKSTQGTSNFSGKYKKFTITNSLTDKTVSQYINSVKYDILVIKQHYQRSSKMVKKFEEFIILPGITANYPYKYIKPLNCELKNSSNYQSFPYSQIHGLLRGNTKITADPDENVIRDYRLKKFKQYRHAYFNDMKAYRAICISDLDALMKLQSKLEKVIKR